VGALWGRMCGWSHTRGTWGGLFFPRPVKEVSDAITLKGCMRGLYLKRINSMI